MTQDQVQALVRDGFGDESGAKLIEQRGIDFVPADELLQTLKTAGATEAFLETLRAVKPSGSASTKKPLYQVQVFALLVGQVPSHRVAILVQERGIDFEPTDDYLQEVRLAGGDDELVIAPTSAKVTKPINVDPTQAARQAEMRQHVARGAELMNAKRYADAEPEYRTAIKLDPQNSDLHVALSRALNGQNKTEDGLLEAREAIRLNPDNDMAHFSLGTGLGLKGDLDGAIAEEREAIRLNPDNDMAHHNLGAALGNKGNWDGQFVEERAALRLNPSNPLAHYGLGVWLERKGNREGALQEYHAAYELDPKEVRFWKAYQRLMLTSIN